MTEYALTQYGFRYGPVNVERLVEHRGYVVLGVETKRMRLEVTVTPSGLIRIGLPVKKSAKREA